MELDNLNELRVVLVVDFDALNKHLDSMSFRMSYGLSLFKNGWMPVYSVVIFRIGEISNFTNIVNDSSGSPLINTVGRGTGIELYLKVNILNDNSGTQIDNI